MAIGKDGPPFPFIRHILFVLQVVRLLRNKILGSGISRIRRAKCSGFIDDRLTASFMDGYWELELYQPLHAS